jgi:hypothetical protein
LRPATISIVVAFVIAIIGIATMVGTASPASAAEPADGFAQGSQSFSLSVEYVRERRNSDINLMEFGAGYGRFVLDNVALELQAVGYRVNDDGPDAGGGANLIGRWHFLNWDRLSLYADASGGIMLTTDDFPEGGTAFNFTYRGGPGASWRLGESLFLVGGAHFQHISNAFIKGRDRNPIFNGFGGYLGLMWTF